MKGCSSGLCNPECSNDSDCPTNNFCVNNKCIQINCTSNSQCFNNQFCEFSSCGSSQGVCVNAPELCTQNYAPVCSCNGQTYSNDCMRKAGKASKAHDGACVIACSFNSDCGSDGFLNLLRCKNNNVYNVFMTFNCSNPGTEQSSCSNSSEEKLIQYCTGNQVCSNGQCSNVSCKSDSDCNDNNARTEDKCINPGTTSSKCEHNTITCLSNSDCGTDGFIGNLFCQTGNTNLFQNYIAYTCNNAGQTTSICTSLTSVKLKTNCTGNQTCSNGACISNTITCFNDSQCNDNNAHTEDKCQSPGTTSSSCVHNTIICLSNSDCGINRFLNESFCDSNSSFDKYITFTCNNPGTSASACTNITENKLVQNCTNGC